MKAATRRPRRLPQCRVWDLGFTPTRAIGVALSVPMSKTPMHECQALAPGVLRHLRAMGWKLVKV